IWLVDLMPVADPALVATAVSGTLGVVERRDMPSLAGLVKHLRAVELLLVLDNCEHLAEACADVANEILRSCAGVRVLATSRVPLAIHGELDYTLEPLPIPEEDTPVDELVRSPSVR